MIESEDVTTSVLLYLHGGMPDYFLGKQYPTGFEDLFTVVWWEQPPGYLAVRDEAMHRLGVGTMHGMTDVMRGLFVGSLQAREYTLGEKVNLWRGKFSTGVSALWSEAIATDLSEKLPAVDVPVYFLHGHHDYTVSYPLARAYLERLRAPVKGFYTFEQSAHSPMFEEPERTQRILREDVLRGTSGRADTPFTVGNAVPASY